MALDGDLVRKRSSDVSRPRKWDAYAKGTKVPVDKPGPRNAIDQAESKFPGAAKWFRSPLWWYLRKDPYDARRIEAALRTLDPKVVSILFEDEPREPLSETRQRELDDEVVGNLINLANFDALVAAVLLAGLSEAIASPELRDRSLQVYTELQPVIIKMPAMQGIYPELLSLIDARCKHWVYISPNLRVEVMVNWRAVQEDRQRKILKEMAEIEKEFGLPSYWAEILHNKNG